MSLAIRSPRSVRFSKSPTAKFLTGKAYLLAENHRAGGSILPVGPLPFAFPESAPRRGAAQVLG